MNGGRRARYDVFLSYNSADRPTVARLAERLRKTGLTVWFDRTALPPGSLWQAELERAIGQARSVLVMIGGAGLGPWEEQEMRAALSELVARRAIVIPVLLPGAPDPESVEVPRFLRQITWEDLRGGLSSAGIARLYWGITGRQLERAQPEPGDESSKDETEEEEEEEETPVPAPIPDPAPIPSGGIAAILLILVLVVVGGLWVRSEMLDRGPDQGPSRTAASDHLIVTNKTMEILGGPPFDGRVAIYVGDISGDRPIDVLTFLAGAEQTRWQPGDRILPYEIAGAVEKERRLFEGRIEPAAPSWEFELDNQTYHVEGEVENNTIGSDRLKVRVTALPVNDAADSTERTNG